MTRIRLRTSSRALRTAQEINDRPAKLNVATFIRPMTIAVVDGCIALTIQDIDGKTYTDSLTRAQSLQFAKQILGA